MASLYNDPEELRVAVQSLKPFLSSLGFVPSRVIPFLQLQPGCESLLAPEYLRRILPVEREGNNAVATSSFFDAILEDNAPSGALTHFMHALLKANRDESNLVTGPWFVHDVITLACAFMPLQIVLLRLLGQEDAEAQRNLDVRSLAYELCQVGQITPEHLTRVHETLEVEGQPHAAIRLLVCLYVESLKEIARDVAEGIYSQGTEVQSGGPPEWVPRLVEMLERRVGPDIRQQISDEVLSSNSWQSTLDQLSFRRNPWRTDCTNEVGETESESGDSVVTVTEPEDARDNGRDRNDLQDTHQALPRLAIRPPEGTSLQTTKVLRTACFINSVRGQPNQISRYIDYFRHEYSNRQEESLNERHEPSDADDTSSVITTTSSNSTENNEAVNEGQRLAPTLQFTGSSDNAMQITLRAYQEELLRGARQGKNTMILLPTGTGKTFIVMKRTEEILSKPGLERVVFLAPKVKLVEQQFQRFQRLLPKSTYLRCGNSRSSNAPLTELLDTFKVFVMTPQCLLEAIQKKEVKITDFSLMILDECHHTHGGHAFKMLMNMYMDVKFGENGSARLPQVIGLTASPGVGKGGTVEVAMSYLKELCCSMDVETISTVKENEEELKKFINEPQHEIHDCPRRRKDMFKKIMISMMNDVETKMKKSSSSHIESCLDKTQKENLRAILAAPELHRGQQIYSNWVFNLSNNLVAFENDKATYISLFSCAEMLQRYQRALILNEDCESRYALDYMRERCQIMRNDAPTVGRTDRELLDHFERNLQALESACNDAEDYNPKLRMLEDILLQILENEQEQEAACMIFVRTLELSKAIQQWIQNHPELKELNPGRITGFRISSSRGGMTKSEISDVMVKFNSGEHKAVVCTSAAEEGLDFQACNVVVRYDYVTNMIAMIQTRGRARRKDSHYLVLGELRNGNVCKEKENLANERVMKQAIDKLQSEMESNPNAFRQWLFQLQNQEWSHRKAGEQTAKLKQAATIANTTKYDLLCRKCSSLACSSTDFRLLGNSSRVVVKEAFKQKLKTKELPERKSFTQHMDKIAKVFCKECSFDWGIMAAHIPSGRELPVLKLESFFLQEARSGKRFPKKVKWGESPFHVIQISDDDLL